MLKPLKFHILNIELEKILFPKVKAPKWNKTNMGEKWNKHQNPQQQQSKKIKTKTKRQKKKIKKKKLGKCSRQR